MPQKSSMSLAVQHPTGFFPVLSVAVQGRAEGFQHVLPSAQAGSTEQASPEEDSWLRDWGSEQ